MNGVLEVLEVPLAPAQLGSVAPMLANGPGALELTAGKHAWVADVAPSAVLRHFASADVQTGAMFPGVTVEWNQ